ncbi:MAG: hypothetical protein HKL86_02315 [Acidimicrobiaceae bacterium]|nr:hypothetical protein [Acidimicrobiaceae bacterium]
MAGKRDRDPRRIDSGELLEVAPRSDRPERPTNQLRSRLSFALMGLDVVLLVFSSLGVTGPLRLLLGLSFGLIVPGWSFVGFLELDSASLEFALSVASSLAILMVIAQIAITLHVWHLLAIQVIVELACLPLLAWRSRVFVRGVHPK